MRSSQSVVRRGFRVIGDNWFSQKGKVITVAAVDVVSC